MDFMSPSAARINKNFPIALVLPCLESRSTIKEVLSSLHENIDLFDYIIISVNGLSVRNVSLALSSLNYKITGNLHLLCTGKSLAPVKHFNFIKRKLQSIVPSQAWLLILADDDLLAPRQNLIQYLEAFKNTNLDKVGMGNFMTFSEAHPHKSYTKQHLNPGESISPSEFLRRNKSEALFTNISSMVVPHAVFRDCIAFMSFWGSSLRRLEYIWLSHRYINKLICPQLPTAFIRLHPSQLGRILSLEAGLRDEWIYIAWIWRNQPSLSPWRNKGDIPSFTIKNFWQLSVFLVKFQVRSLPALSTVLRAFRPSR